MKSNERQRKRAGVGAKVFYFFLFTGQVLAAPQTENLSPEYRALLTAIGQENHRRADSLLQAFFQRPEVPPAVMEIAALNFAYQDRLEAGRAFFDSLRAARKPRAEVLAALALVHHYKHESPRSYELLKQALEAGSTMLHAYELFAVKSFEFELKSETSAFEFLTKFSERFPDNWRYRFALAVWHSTNGNPQRTSEILRGLLQEGHAHWRIFARLGSNLSYLGNTQEALAAYEAGMRFCESRADDEGRVRMWYGRADVLFTLGRTQEARAALQQADELARGLGDQAFYSRLNLMQSRLMIKDLQWLRASAFLQTAQEQARRYADGIILLHTFYHRSNLNRLIGKWAEATANTLQTAVLADSIGLSAYKTSLLSILATIDLEAGRYEEALARFRDMDRAAREEGARLQRLPFLLGAIKTLHALERYAESLAEIEEGLLLVKESGNLSQLLDFQTAKGRALLHTGKAAEARTRLQQTVETARQSGHPLQWLDAGVLLAETMMRGGEIAEAQELLLLLIGTLKEVPPYNVYLQLTAQLAETHMRQNELARAIAVYRTTIEEIAVQTHMQRPSSLAALTKDERALFGGLSTAYLRAGQKAQALAATESAHDLIVRRKRLQARLLNAAPFDERLQHQLARLDSLALAARLQKITAPSPTEALKIEGRIRALENQRMAILDRIFPENFLPTFKESEFHFGEFQNLLRARNELAVKFFVGTDHCLTFFVSADTLEAREIPYGRAQLTQLLEKINPALKLTLDPNEKLHPAQFDTVAAFDAYQALLADELQQRTENRLMIVPDDVLHAMPFDLFVTAVKPRPKFLVESFVIRNGISFSSLQQEAHPLWHVLSVVMLADPTLPSLQAQASTAQRGEEIFLPVGRKEFEAVRKIVRLQEELVDDEASRRLFFPALKKSEWFHFASHSFGRRKEPLFGELILAAPHAQARPERAYAFEIFQMHLPTKMVILSGCETARGTFFNGEGFEGFVQAFRAAGTESVIASLWRVENHAAAAFFEHYYRALVSGGNTSLALQAAKLKLLADPRYGVLDWAAFNYYGHDWEVEMPKAGTPFTYTLLGAALLTLVLVLAVYYRKALVRK